MSYRDYPQVADVVLVRGRTVVDYTDTLGISGFPDSAHFALANIVDTAQVRDRVTIVAEFRGSAIYTTLTGAFGRYADTHVRWYADTLAATTSTVVSWEQRSIEARIEFVQNDLSGGVAYRVHKVFADTDAPIFVRVGDYEYSVDRAGYLAKGLVPALERLAIRSLQYNVLRAISFNVTFTSRMQRR